MIRIVAHISKKHSTKNQYSGIISSQKLFWLFIKFNKIFNSKPFLAFCFLFLYASEPVYNAINSNKKLKNFKPLHVLEKNNICYLWLCIYILYFYKTMFVLKTDMVKMWATVMVDSLTWTYRSPVEMFSQRWENIRKLKRPFTEGGIHEHFLKEWRKKIDGYDKLGFIKLGYVNNITTNLFYIIRSKPTFFCKDLVSINGGILVTPKLSSSSINKFLSIDQLSSFEFQFLRKNKVYNKGRYSRCRQNYRTGVYMCMYLSVCSIFGLYYWFYSFSFNFTYLWWLFIAFVGSFFLPKIIKYRLYEPYTLLNKFFDTFKWFFSLLKL